MQITNRDCNYIEMKTFVKCFKKAGFLKEVEISNYKDSKENDTHTVESINEEWFLISKAF